MKRRKIFSIIGGLAVAATSGIGCLLRQEKKKPDLNLLESTESAPNHSLDALRYMTKLPNTRGTRPAKTRVRVFNYAAIYRIKTQRKQARHD